MKGNPCPKKKKRKNKKLKFSFKIEAITFSEIDDTKEGVNKKLRLLLLLPRSRAKRLLNTWPHAVSLMIRAREHALNILSGVQSSRPRGMPHSRRTAQSSRGDSLFQICLGFFIYSFSELCIRLILFPFFYFHFSLLTKNICLLIYNFFTGLAAFPSADRLSPLDTFLDLLTAKGSYSQHKSQESKSLSKTFLTIWRNAKSNLIFV